jgi:hypothetical protein
MSGAQDPSVVTSVGSLIRLSVVPAPRDERHAGGSLPRIDADGVVMLPRPGQPGHGRTASLRRQSVWIAHERMSRLTGAFELICGDCGDHPYLDYPDLPSRLQQIRGPYTREAGLAAYAKHLGLVPRLHEPARLVRR